MIVKSIAFENFRNLKNTKIFPSEGINVIYGDNAQGKTNLIEALWLMTGGRSFRGSKDGELIAFGKKYANVCIEFFSEERDQELKILINTGKRTAVLNDVEKNYMSQIVGCFCAVVFSPDHLTLVKGGPDERRNFIDAAICQIKPAYASHLSRYRRIMNERNSLLKDIPRHRELEDTLEIWNDRLVYEGAAIALERFDYVSLLSDSSSEFYEGISSGKEKLSVEYRTSYGGNENMDFNELRNRMWEILREKQKDDVYFGYTTSGIHRDDLIVKINGMEARSFGSQGQQRSSVLAMKLAEAEILGNKKGEKPVILLDDVLSELDRSRQEYLLKKLGGMQVFITCCESDTDAENRILIKDGELFVHGGDQGVSSSRQ